MHDEDKRKRPNGIGEEPGLWEEKRHCDLLAAPPAAWLMLAKAGLLARGSKLQAAFPGQRPVASGPSAHRSQLRGQLRHYGVPSPHSLFIP